MCLGIPVKIVSVDKDKKGQVDYLGTRIKANFALLDEARIGDWVIIHAGFAISKLDEAEAQETLSLLRQLARAGDGN